MIGDLTSAPEPIQIKLFSQDPRQLEEWAPKSPRPSEDQGVVDILNGIENTISGPAVTFQVDPSVAARAGFTAEEVALDASAILEGEPAPTPVSGQRPRLHAARAFSRFLSRVARSHARYLTGQQHWAHGDSGRAADDSGESGSDRDPSRKPAARRRQSPPALKAAAWAAAWPTCKKSWRALHIPSSIRVEYGGTYQEQQQSFHDLVIVLILAVLLLFIVLLFEFGTFAAPIAILSSALLSTSGVFIALLITRTTFNISSFMGMIMVIGIVAKNGILLLDADHKMRVLGFDPEKAMLQAARRRLRPIVMTALATVAGMLPLAFALGAGSQMLQPLAIAVIGGVLISMVLSLIITPAVHFYLGGKDEPDVAMSSEVAE